MRKQFLVFLMAGCALHVGAQRMTDTVHVLKEVEVRGVRTPAPASVSKIPATIRQVPMTVNVLSSDQIKEMNFWNTTEALRDVPGVSAIRDYGAFDMFYIRGFYESVVLYDGIRDERHTIWQSAPITGLSSVDRIEVLKGSSSMTIGHSALGGVINIVRKKPTVERHLNARLSVGTWNTINGQVGVSGTLSKKLTFRADVGAGRSDGWRGNYTRMLNGYVAFDYTLSDYQRLTLQLTGNTDRYQGDYGQPHLQWDVYSVATGQLVASKGSFNSNVKPSVSYSDPRDELKNKNLGVTVGYEHKFKGGWKLTNRAAVSFDDIDYYSTDGLYYLTSTTAGSYPYYYTASDGTTTYISLDSIQRDGFAFAYTTRSIQNQLDFTGKKVWGNTTHNLLAGYNLALMRLSRFDRASYSGSGAGSVITVENPVLDQGPVYINYTRRQLFNDAVHGFYVQDYITWNKWAALIGFRLDHFRRHYIINNTDNKTVGSETYNNTTTNLAPTYRLGLVYNVTKSLNFYASTSNMYKPQRVALSSDVMYIDNNGNEMSASDLSKLAPQKGVQYEAGLHFDGIKNFSLNASVYHISLSNVLQTDLGQTSDGRNIGGLVGRSVSKGVELEAAYSPISALDFSVNYDYTDARVKEYSNTTYSSSSVTVGNHLKRVPLHKLSAWGFFNHSFANKGKLRIGLGVINSGRSYTDTTNDYLIPSYTVFHALASYRFKQYTLQVNANNLFDKTYYRNVINSVQYIPAEGRNVMASIAFDI